MLKPKKWFDNALRAREFKRFAWSTHTDEGMNFPGSFFIPKSFTECL
jgi:hypothetical protein